MNKVKILLDSGAFGAWRRGLDINLKTYIAYLKQNVDLLDSYVALDVIPGGHGELARDNSSVEQAASQSYDNLQRMKDAGLTPMAVYHYGEDIKWLHKLVEDREPYIGLGGMVGIRDKHGMRPWLKRCFSVIPSTTKVHGFGMTVTALVVDYPWFSVDSTSWALAGGYGKIRIPVSVNGSWNYRYPPIEFSITDRVQTNERLEKAVADHAGNVGSAGPLEQKLIQQFLTEAGTNLAEIRNDDLARKLVYVYYYQMLAEYKRNTSKKPFTVIFACTYKYTFQDALLNRRQALDRLYSYFELQQEGRDLLESLTFDTKTEIVPKKPSWKNRRYLSIRRIELAKRAQNDVEAS